MAAYFLDTSALVKHYHPEAGTAEVDRLWTNPTDELYISRLGVVETVSVFAKKVRNGLIAPADFGLMRRRFFADVRRRRPVVVRLLVKHARDAVRLLQQYGPTHSLYALDALQLAVALDLRSRGTLGTFMAADRVLLTVAVQEGLTIIDPENP